MEKHEEDCTCEACYKRWKNKREDPPIDELSKCNCGARVIALDDGMSLIITCQKCDKSTEEYLYGAGSFLHVLAQITKDWNKLVA